MTKKEYIERYGEEWYKEYLEKKKKYYQENIGNIKEYKKQYYKDNAEHIKEQKRIFYKDNIDYFKQYYKDNTEYFKQYQHTKIGRANSLVQAYKQIDKRKNRGECTLTSDWIVENIFNSKCVYCGETDWKKLGCDRIDNSLPHTQDNVVCSCWDCNNERKSMSFEEFTQKKTTSK